MVKYTECIWCGGQFIARKPGGHEKQYCSSSCKDTYHRILHQYAQKSVEQGEITLEELKAFGAS